MTAMERVANLDELAVGERKSIFVDDTPVLLVRLDDSDYACIEDVCTHDGNPLTDGPIQNGEITCPRHGARFDLKTGAALCMPAIEPVATFAVEIRDDGIYAGPKSAEMPNTVRSSHAPSVSPRGETLASSPPAVDPNTGEPSLSDEGKLIDALRQVIDPELMINIIDLGLVYGVNYHPDRRMVDIEMTLTSPACPAGPQIIQQSKMALERLAGVQQANIKLVMSPPWSPDRMTDEARDMLGIF